MSVTETSKQSYRKLKDLGPRQKAVHSAIGEMGLASNREVAEYLQLPVNQITGRVKELREVGLVKEHGKKWDSTTKRNVIAWCVAEPQKHIDLESDPADDIKEWSPAAVSWLDD